MRHCGCHRSGELTQHPPLQSIARTRGKLSLHRTFLSEFDPFLLTTRTRAVGSAPTRHSVCCEEKLPNTSLPGLESSSLRQPCVLGDAAPTPTRAFYQRPRKQKFPENK